MKMSSLPLFALALASLAAPSAALRVNERPGCHKLDALTTAVTLPADLEKSLFQPGPAGPAWREACTPSVWIYVARWHGAEKFNKLDKAGQRDLLARVGAEFSELRAALDRVRAKAAEIERAMAEYKEAKTSYARRQQLFGLMIRDYEPPRTRWPEKTGESLLHGGVLIPGELYLSGTSEGGGLLSHRMQELARLPLVSRHLASKDLVNRDVFMPEQFAQLWDEADQKAWPEGPFRSALAYISPALGEELSEHYFGALKHLNELTAGLGNRSAGEIKGELQRAAMPPHRQVKADILDQIGDPFR